MEHTGTPHSFKHGPDLQSVNRTTAQQINLTSVYNYILHISMHIYVFHAYDVAFTYFCT